MLDELVRRATALVDGPHAAGGRAILGIAGVPGAGKTTLAEQLVARLDPEGTWVARVQMDAFHLADAALVRLGLRDRKGAVETFDAYGYLALLRRIHAETATTIYAPDFERTIEQPIGSSIPVPPSARLIVTEGNYLLHDGEPWPAIRAELAEVWFVTVDDALRRERLHARHVRFGKAPDAAWRWIETVDEPDRKSTRLNSSH